MEDRSNDISVLAQILRLINEERRLYDQGVNSTAQRDSLKRIKLKLHQYRNLLRQRRPIRETFTILVRGVLCPPEVFEPCTG